MRRWILIVLVALGCGALVAIVGFTQIKIGALQEPGHFETVLATRAKHIFVRRSSRDGIALAPTNLQASIEEGDKLFGTECAACHGLDTTNSPMPAAGCTRAPQISYRQKSSSIPIASYFGL